MQRERGQTVCSGGGRGKNQGLHRADAIGGEPLPEVEERECGKKVDDRRKNRTGYT